MFVHTVIMVIEPHMKQGRQHKLISTIFLATSVTKKLDHNRLRFRHCSSTSKIIAAQGKSISSTVSLDIAKSSLRNTVRKSQFIKRRSKPLTNCRLQSSHPVNYEEFHQLAVQKKQDYAEYRQIRKEKEELLIAKRTVEMILNIDRQKEQEQEKKSVR